MEGTPPSLQVVLLLSHSSGKARSGYWGAGSGCKYACSRCGLSHIPDSFRVFFLLCHPALSLLSETSPQDSKPSNNHRANSCLGMGVALSYSYTND